MIRRLPRLPRFVLLACGCAVLWGLVPPYAVHADAATGSCSSSAHANAQSYDGTSSGSADNSFSADGYTIENCVGLSQTNAIFTAGLACENAGIRAGGEHGIGFAIVVWTAVWQDSTSGDVTTVGPIQQQYDCGDTFS